MRDIMGMIAKVQALQSKMQDLQVELERTEVVGVAGGGFGAGGLAAKGEMKGVSIDVSLLKEEEKEIVEDLVLAAHNDARAKGEAMAQERMSALTAGLPIPPGMKLPF